EASRSAKGRHAPVSALLALGSARVGIAFRPSAPAGIPRVERPGPAGCAYWTAAAEGAVFYTEASDHYNCPVGAYTHGVELPAERAADLHHAIGTTVPPHNIR